jgi:hypothetical protein
MAGQRGAVKAGARYPDRMHPPKAAHPLQQRPVPGRGGRELRAAGRRPFISTTAA